MSGKARAYSVQSLTQLIKYQLDGCELLQNIWVKGEISNFTQHASRHMYFTLKDESAKIRCVMFAGQNARLSFLPKNGNQVFVLGNISMYDRDGNVQLYVSEMQPDGIGSLYLKFEHLKQKLLAEGLFDNRIKKEIPKYPHTIGVITSETGAVLRDIYQTIRRRNPRVNILLYPAHVQGEHAVPTLIRGIEVMNRMQAVDVIIIGRGGGSIEELWAFNDELLARAIAKSRIPVVSGVGHETDVTICDFVADRRAETPTAAAVLCTTIHTEDVRFVYDQKERMIYSIHQMIQKYQNQLDRIRHGASMQKPRQRILYWMERMDRTQEQLRYLLRDQVRKQEERLQKLQTRLQKMHPSIRIERSRMMTNRHKERLIEIMSRRQHILRDHLKSTIRTLDALSPLQVMLRGYGLVYEKNQEQIIRSVQEVRIGDEIHVRIQDGHFNCTVQSKEETK